MIHMTIGVGDMSEDRTVVILDSLTSLSEMDLIKAEEILAAFRAAYPEMAAFGERLVRCRIDELAKIELPKASKLKDYDYCRRCKAQLKKKRCRVCGTFN